MPLAICCIGSETTAHVGNLSCQYCKNLQFIISCIVNPRDKVTLSCDYRWPARKPEDPPDHWKCTCNKANTIEVEEMLGNKKLKLRLQLRGGSNPKYNNGYTGHLIPIPLQSSGV